MIKTLIITDHFELYDYVKSISKDYDIDYKSSSIKTLPIVNLKDKTEVTEIVKKYDCVISLHCKQIFPKELYENVRCINIHPGYNPFNRGYFSHIFSIINKLPCGITVHEINGIIDGGDIITQEEIVIEEHETSSDVYDKMIAAEKALILRHLSNLIDGNYITNVIIGKGNFNKKIDYDKICELNLNHVGTLQDHLDLLRALTHGDYDNAFFYNKSKEKIFVKINLKK